MSLCPASTGQHQRPFESIYKRAILLGFFFQEGTCNIYLRYTSTAEPDDEDSP